MAIKAVVKITNPDEVEASLTLMMPVREWKRLRSQLRTDYPSWVLGREISSLLKKAEESFFEVLTGEAL